MATTEQTLAPVHPEPWPPRARTIVLLLALFIMLGFGDKAILGLVGPSMMDDLGLTNTEFGLIGSSFYLLFCFSAIGIGLLGDRVSPRWLLLGLALVWSVAQLPVLLPVVGFAGLIGTRILLGAGEGPALPLALHTAFTWAPLRSRALASGLIAIGGSVGVVVGAPLLMLAIQAWGWRSPFGILGLLGLILAVAWLRSGGVGPFLYAVPSTTAGHGPSGDHQQPRHVPYRRIFALGTWWGSVLAGFAVWWTLGLALTWLPTYLERQAGYDPSTVSLLVGLPSVGGIVSTLGAGLVADRLLRRGSSRRAAYGLVPAVALVIGGVALLAMSRLGAGWPLLAAMAVGFSAGPALTPLANAAIADVAPPAQRSGVMSAAHALGTTGSIAAPFVSGLIVDLAPTEDAGFPLALDLAGVLALGAAVLAATVIRPDRHAARLSTNQAVA